MKKVVVTGAKGFTGRSIVKLLRRSYPVLGVDLKPAEFNEADYRRADLEDGAAVHDVLAGADAVVHFGGYPTDSQASWERVYRNLSLGGYHVLQAAANLKIGRVILASSPTIWGLPGTLSYLPVDEDHPQQPGLIYAAVKQHLEGLADHYARWHGMTVVSLRPLRIVYEGSYDWRFRHFTENDEAAADLWGYVDARDVAQACQAALEADLSGHEVFVIGAADVCVETPTQDLIRRFYPHIDDIRGSMGGSSALYDASKAKHMLGWKPRHHWRAMAKERGSERG